MDLRLYSSDFTEERHRMPSILTTTSTTTDTMSKTTRDVGEVMGELEDMAVDLGRAEGSLYMCRLLRKHKVGTNSIESEAAKMWSQSCQRAVGGVDMAKERGKRNVRVVMEKVETLRREVAISVSEGRLRLEEKVKEVFRELSLIHI